MFVPFLVVALIFAFTSLKNTTKITRPHIDYLSIIESAIGFASLVASVSLASDLGLTSPLIIGLFVWAIVVLVFYVHRQLNLKNPVLYLKIFSITQFRTGALLVMVDFEIILSTMYLLPQFIQKDLSLAVALTGIINAITSALAGRIYDSQGAKRPAVLGFIIAFIGALMLALATPSAPVWYIILSQIILMIGCPLTMSPSQTYALNTIQGPASADGSAIMNTLQQIVGAVATAIATILLAMGQGMSKKGGVRAVRFTNGAHYGFYFNLNRYRLFIKSYN